MSGLQLRSFFVLYFIGCVVEDIGCTQLRRQAVLHELLKKNSTDGVYDSTIAPNFEEDVSTNITIQIVVQNIYAVSESSMEFSVDIILRQTWTDKRLQYDNMSNLDFIEFDTKLMNSVWVPDTYFANEKKASVHMVTQPNKMMHLFRNGTVLYSMRLSLTLGCPMNLRKYPMDEQNCPIIIQSYAYTVGNVKFFWDAPNPIKINQQVIMPQFDASEGARSGHCIGAWKSVEFSCLQTEIYLGRKMGYYIVQVFIPSIMIVVLSWVSFWVDYDAVPARISLGVLTVLTMTTQSSGARQSLPQVSYIKAIDVWMFTCLLFVFNALLEYSYVNVVARRYKKKPVKPASKESSETHCDTALQKKTVLQQENGAFLASDEDHCWRRLLDARHVDKLSRRVFPLAFVVFNVAFWIFYTFLPNPEPE